MLVSAVFTIACSTVLEQKKDGSANPMLRMVTFSRIACTGLPDPMTKHAETLALFAQEIMSEFNVIMHQLAEKFGEDTRSMKLRIGLNSGSTTAGVLRGKFLASDRLLLIHYTSLRPHGFAFFLAIQETRGASSSLETQSTPLQGWKGTSNTSLKFY